MKLLKKVTALAFVAMIAFTPPVSAATHVAKDKWLHFGCSTGIEVVLAEIPPFKKWTPLERALFNVTLFGIGKELYDRSRGKRFDWKDVGADAAGALFGEFTVRIVGNRW